MKLRELKEKVDELIKYNPDYEVVVQLQDSKRTMGTTSNSKISKIRCGFDWDNGFIFIVPENNLTTINKSESHE